MRKDKKTYAKRKKRKGGRKNMGYDDSYGNWEDMYDDVTVGGRRYDYGYNGYGYGYGSYGYGYGSGYQYGYGGATAAVKQEEAADPALVKILAAQKAAMYKSKEEALANSEGKEDAYFPINDGYGVVYTRTLNGNTYKFITHAKSCPLVDALQDEIILDVNSKIPKELLEEIIGTFAYVNEKSHNEAAAQIYREKEGEHKYFIYYPVQEISGGQVKYTDDPNIVELRKTNDLVMELHSHNTMSAFWSGTDDNNENEFGLYMVIGTFGAPSATYKCRVKYGKVYVNFEANCVFDMTPEEEIAMFKRENWKQGNREEIDKKAKASTYSYSYSGTSYTGYSLTADEINKLAEALKTAPDELSYKTSSELCSALWRCATVDPKYSRYVSNGFIWMDNADKVRCWIRISSLSQEEQKALVVETPDAVNVATRNYVNGFGNRWARNNFRNNGTKSNLEENAKRTVEYLNGTGNIDVANKTALPGDAIPPTTVLGDLYGAGVNDDAIEKAIQVEAEARIATQDNIEAALADPQGIGLATETPAEFLQCVYDRADNTTVVKHFSLKTMWELLSKEEKLRLAMLFTTNVVELGAWMYGVEDGIHIDLVKALYRAIVAPEEILYEMCEEVNKALEEALANGLKDAFDGNTLDSVNKIDLLNKYIHAFGNT